MADTALTVGWSVRRSVICGTKETDSQLEEICNRRHEGRTESTAAGSGYSGCAGVDSLRLKYSPV